MIILIFLYFYSILRVMISDQHTLYDSGKTPPTLSNLLFKDHINLKLSYDEDMLKKLYTFFCSTFNPRTCSRDNSRNCKNKLFVLAEVLHNILRSTELTRF